MKCRSVIGASKWLWRATCPLFSDGKVELVTSEGVLRAFRGGHGDWGCSEGVGGSAGGRGNGLAGQLEAAGFGRVWRD